jgi:hypothetical protein
MTMLILETRFLPPEKTVSYPLSSRESAKRQPKTGRLSLDVASSVGIVKSTGKDHMTDASSQTQRASPD